MLKILEIVDINDEKINEIKEFSLLPNKRIGWNYPLDYSFVEDEFSRIKIDETMEFLDIGCGPGAIHGYLENKYNINIEGIDMQRWGKDYVDYVGNFLDDSLINKKYDVIFSISAFEHQSKEEHIKCIEKSKRLLKDGGYLFITAAISETTNQERNQLNLSRKELEEMYEDTFDKSDDLSNIKKTYETRFKKELNNRYGTDKISFMTFGYVYKKEIK